MIDDAVTVADFLLKAEDRAASLNAVESRADQLACLAVNLRDDPSEVALEAFKACRDLLAVEIEKALIIEAASSEAVAATPARKGKK
jgi:hypothetical protein